MASLVNPFACLLGFPYSLVRRFRVAFTLLGQQAVHQRVVSDRQRQLRAAGPFPPALGAVLRVVAEVAPLAERR